MLNRDAAAFAAIIIDLTRSSPDKLDDRAIYLPSVILFIVTSRARSFVKS